MATSNLLATYSAIQILVIIKKDIPGSETLKSSLCQRIANASFTNHEGLGSSDIRFLYCLVGSLHLLGHSFTDAETEAVTSFILSCQSPEGCFGCEPNAEGHAGHTFCALASLCMVKSEIPNRQTLSEWLSRRLALPSGRPGKPLDVCYAWWVGASASIIGLNAPSFEKVIDQCKAPSGGFSPRPGSSPDLFHSFFATASSRLSSGCVDPSTAMPLH